MLHRSVQNGTVASVGAGGLGPVITGPVPLNDEEEYVGASPRFLGPLLLAAALMVFGAAFWWERRKDRRVAAARRAHGFRLDKLRYRPSEETT